MKTDGTPYQIRTGKPVKKDAIPRQPNEIDESEDSQQSGERDVMKQAYTDIMSGQIDTDLRKQPGVEETVKDRVKKPAEQPVVPETKKGRT